LNWDEARLMQQSGHITLGAHTQSHPILSRIADAAIQQEIQGSRDDIAQQLGVTPKLFAYPNGRKADFDERSKRSLTQLGFTCAVTTEAGVNNAQTDPLELHRLQAWDGDAFAMTARIALELLRG